MVFFTKKEVNSSNEIHGAGLKHWFYQKLSALAMLPLTLWFVVNLPFFISLNFVSKLNWLTKFPNFILLVLFFVVASFHMKLGLTVVIEDYIHNRRIKRILLTLVTIFSLVLPVKIVVLFLLLRGQI